MMQRRRITVYLYMHVKGFFLCVINLLGPPERKEWISAQRRYCQSGSIDLRQG